MESKNTIIDSDFGSLQHVHLSDKEAGVSRGVRESEKGREEQRLRLRRCTRKLHQQLHIPRRRRHSCCSWRRQLRREMMALNDTGLS